MVRAILEGRKTQTRRIIKPQPDFLQIYNWKGRTVYEGEARQWCWMGMVLENIWDFVANRKQMVERCPYGQIGDFLWVRETWRPGDEIGSSIYYRADEEWNVGAGWKPSIHMPRRASRITLEITAVRVERLHDISEDDAFAEGITDIEGPNGNETSYKYGFLKLWDKINGKASTDENPWVWVVGVKRV